MHNIKGGYKVLYYTLWFMPAMVMGVFNNLAGSAWMMAFLFAKLIHDQSI